MRKSFLVLTALLISTLCFAAEDTAEPATKTLVWPDGTRYIGGVVEGKRLGKGTIFWQDGTRFVGEFVNDMRNGPGTMILPDGTVYTGYFKDDELIDSPAESISVASTSEPAPGSITQTTAIAGVSLEAPKPTEQSPELPEYKPITQLTAETRQQLIETINLWSAAWSDKNVPQYLSNYSRDFVVPGNLSRKSWEGLRRSRLKRPKYIDVTIEYEKFEIVEADTADVYFTQTYRSNTYNDITRKVLRLHKEGHAWMILVERNR